METKRVGEDQVEWNIWMGGKFKSDPNSEGSKCQTPALAIDTKNEFKWI